MNHKLAIIILVLLTFIQCQKTDRKFDLRNGDIIFQRSMQPQHLVMSFLDISFYNHCGVIIIFDDEYYVISAEKTVTYTPLKEWISRGASKKYQIMRPQKEWQNEINSFLRQARFYKGKIYDFQYTWDDKKIYNSELIQKAFYKSNNVYLGEFIKVTGVSVPPQDSTLFKSCEQFVPYNKEIVTVNALMNSPYLKNFIFKK